MHDRSVHAHVLIPWPSPPALFNTATPLLYNGQETTSGASGNEPLKQEAQTISTSIELKEYVKEL